MVDASYNRYINSREWRVKRQKFLDFMFETNGKLSCQKCKKPYKKGFHVHHTDYTRFKNEDFGDMVLLCEPCHRKTHGMKPVKRYNKIPPVLKIYRNGKEIQ